MKKIAALIALVTLAAYGCDTGTRPSGRDGGGGGDPMMDGGTTLPDGSRPPPPPSDAAVFDPFDPSNACGLSTIPTQQVPGSLLIVFDKSGSMSNEVSGDGSPSKWSLATSAINNVLGAVSDELSAGLLLFPDNSDCGTSSTPDVPIGPLSTTRSQISSELFSNSPGGNTPAFAALLAGYDYLATLSTPGQRGIVLVSDGGESCDLDRRDEVFARVEMERRNNNRLTFAVGLDYADNNLSTIAYNGGTPRTPDCLPTCTSDSCLDNSDCTSGNCIIPGGSLIPSGVPIAGFCDCESTSDCVMPQTCEAPPFAFCPPGSPPDFCEALMASTCQGDANCCHYNAAAGDFQAEFEAALDDIARRLLDSCVFDVPRGTDPSTFDPSLVNVGVTFDGEERTVLRQSRDPSLDSWTYTDDGNTSIIIQGPICDRLLGGDDATVEIVLGCPTILI